MSEIVREEVKAKKLILTPEETRGILGFSKNKMYELLASDETFPCWREGAKWCINADKLQEWIDRQTNRR